MPFAAIIRKTDPVDKLVRAAAFIRIQTIKTWKGKSVQSLTKLTLTFYNPQSFTALFRALVPISHIANMI